MPRIFNFKFKVNENNKHAAIYDPTTNEVVKGFTQLVNFSFHTRDKTHENRVSVHQQTRFVPPVRSRSSPLRLPAAKRHPELR